MTIRQTGLCLLPPALETAPEVPPEMNRALLSIVVPLHGVSPAPARLEAVTIEPTSVLDADGGPSLAMFRNDGRKSGRLSIAGLSSKEKGTSLEDLLSATCLEWARMERWGDDRTLTDRGLASRARNLGRMVRGHPYFRAIHGDNWQDEKDT
jgi:hypothetical protein